MGKIVSLIGIILLVVVGYFGYQYYNDTYKTVTAYALTPAEIPVKVVTKDVHRNGVEGSYSYKYSVDFVKENGERQKMNFEVSGKDPQPFEAKSYIKAEISNRRVNSPVQISPNNVPNKVKELLNKKK